MMYFLLVIALFFGSCSHNTPKEKVRLGMDTTWYPLNFGEYNPYVNGFIDDLLQEIAKEKKIEFEKVPITSNYDAALSSLPPYTFNQAKYDFSQNFLRIGPVLILPANVKTKKLRDMEGDTVGILSGNEITQVLQKYPDIVVKNYPTTTALLDAVVSQEIQGALLGRIEAVAFTTGVYHGKLKIASLPLNDAGLHFIAQKGKHEHLIHSIDQNITELKKKKFYKELLEKWKL